MNTDNNMGIGGYLRGLGDDFKSMGGNLKGLGSEIVANAKIAGGQVKDDIKGSLPGSKSVEKFFGLNTVKKFHASAQTFRAEGRMSKKEEVLLIGVYVSTIAKSIAKNTWKEISRFSHGFKRGVTGKEFTHAHSERTRIGRQRGEELRNLGKGIAAAAGSVGGVASKAASASKDAVGRGIEKAGEGLRKAGKKLKKEEPPTSQRPMTDTRHVHWSDDDDNRPQYKPDG